MSEDVKGIIFDMDGVLVDSMKYHARSFEIVLGEIGVEVEKEKIYELEGEGGYLLIKEILEEKDIEVNEEKMRELAEKRREIFSDINNTKPYPGMENLLYKLKNHYKLALVSGSNDETVENFVEKYFPDDFDVVVGGDDTEGKKPRPDPYLTGLEKLDLPKEEVIVIENAPLGVEAAKRAGLECWAVASYLTMDKLKEADLVFPDHRQLINHMEKELL